VIRVVSEHNIMSKNFLKGVLGIEIIIVLGTYRTWHYMNTDQTYRKWMHDNYPTLLKDQSFCNQTINHYINKQNHYGRRN